MLSMVSTAASSERRLVTVRVPYTPVLGITPLLLDHANGTGGPYQGLPHFKSRQLVGDSPPRIPVTPVTDVMKPSACIAIAFATVLALTASDASAASTAAPGSLRRLKKSTKVDCEVDADSDDPPPAAAAKPHGKPSELEEVSTKGPPASKPKPTPASKPTPTPKPEKEGVDASGEEADGESEDDDATPIKDDDPKAKDDPTQANFHLHALAIGDWGVGGGSCCAKYNRTGEARYRDEQAQSNIAHLMSLSAERLKPKAVIGHGDNFYWNGVGPGDADQRFEDTFEGVYSQPSLEEVTWMNVMGNHDYGGAAYICGDSADSWRPCESIEEMEAALDEKFSLQSKYKSPHGDRWQMPSHYYKRTIKDKTTGVTVDIFNVDTNAATNHGAEQVCCQCYGYMGPLKKGDEGWVDCNTVHRGHKLCFGGDTGMTDACLAKFKSWTDDSLAKLIKDTKESKADWKVVNSHYSPHYHMPEPMMNAWYKALEEGKVQLFLNGHTHAEAIDFADFNVHFVTNGAGGGIQSEAAGDVPGHIKRVQKVWRATGDPYGYFEISFAKDWLKLQFVTFDDKWKFAESSEETTKGKGKIAHCYLIPKSGGKGRPCE